MSYKVLLLGVQLGLVLVSGGLVLGGLFPRHLLGFLDVSLFQAELLSALSQQILAHFQFIVGLAEPGLRLSDALLEVHLRFFHHRHPGLHLLQAGTVKCLELLEVDAHGLKELLLLGTAAIGARFVNNLKPGGGERLVIEHLPLGWRAGARRSWEVDEHVVAHFKYLLEPEADEEEALQKKYTSVMIRVCHSRSLCLSCMYIHDKLMTESR